MRHALKVIDSGVYYLVRCACGYETRVPADVEIGIRERFLRFPRGRRVWEPNRTPAAGGSNGR